VEHRNQFKGEKRALSVDAQPPEPWYRQDPWEALDPLYETDEEEPIGMPMTIGPGNLTNAPASGIDLNSGAMARLVKSLSWRVSSTNHPQGQIKVG